jgi:hypothetical protein
MSDSKLDGPNPDQAASVNVDDLLAQVQKMADKVEDLIDSPAPEKENPPSPETPPTAPESASADDAAAPAPEPVPAGDPEPPAEPGGEIPLPAAGDGDIPLDEGTKKLADDEINQVLNRIQKKDGDAAPADSSADTEADRIQRIQSLPAWARRIRGLLVALDRPFFWIPRTIKNVVGYVGLALLVSATFLWIVLLCSGKK